MAQSQIFDNISSAIRDDLIIEDRGFSPDSTIQSRQLLKNNLQIKQVISVP